MLREPLLHFALLGTLVFAIYNWLNPHNSAAQDPKTIQVTHDALLTFIQQRNKTFDDDAATKQLARMPAAQLQAVMDDFIAEQALYRSALSLGLDQGDYVIRRRLVQKMDFMGRGITQRVGPPNEAELSAYFSTNIEQYRQPATLTFAHVFLRAGVQTDSNNKAEPDQQAEQLKQQLNNGNISFNNAGRFGQRFLYQRNYVERPAEELASHFGPAMATQLFKLQPSALWQGPLQSIHGLHLVLLTQNQPSRLPRLADVRDALVRDFLLAQAQGRQREFTQAIVAEYQTQIDPELQAAATAPNP